MLPDRIVLPFPLNLVGRARLRRRTPPNHVRAAQRSHAVHSGRDTCARNLSFVWACQTRLSLVDLDRTFFGVIVMFRSLSLVWGCAEVLSLWRYGPASH